MPLSYQVGVDIVKRTVSLPGKVWDSVGYLSVRECEGNRSGMVTRLLMEALAARGDGPVLYQEAPEVSVWFDPIEGAWRFR